MMAKCDNCQKPTNKEPEQRIGMSGDQEVPYSMPVYCDDCEHDFAVWEAEMRQMDCIRRELYERFSQGLGSAG